MSESSNVRVLIQMPASAKHGDVITIRATIAHAMETGYRRGSDGQMLPRELLRRFSCTVGGQPIFTANLHASISANPYLAFHWRAERSGPLVFRWEGDREFSVSRSQEFALT